MTTVSVSAKDASINRLLARARRGTIILESAKGERFALTPVDDWEGYEVGRGADFAVEIARTAANKRLISALAARRTHAKGRVTPIAAVKKSLGLK